MCQTKTWLFGAGVSLALVVFYVAAGGPSEAKTTRGPSWAKTADGLTPAVETVCDGLPGAEFGLCNAYCEAIDCDTRAMPLKACESLRSNYFELTGSSTFPCDLTCTDLPDPECSSNGIPGFGDDGCEVCFCDPNWSGADCATCDAGFDRCGECGGNNDCEG